MKGIILAGGSGTRLHPITKGTSKQLLPIYDKPMIYYPLSLLMLAGINEILIITTETDQNSFQRLLGNGQELGISIQYAVQKNPNGLAEAFVIGKKFIGRDNVCLILGDNILYGRDVPKLLEQAKQKCIHEEAAIIFGYNVEDPERYGVAETDVNGVVITLEEKPSIPKSNNAVIGIYFYPNTVTHYVEDIQPSKRGELEITDLNKIYMNKGLLQLQPLGRGIAWFDTGTHDSLIEASEFIRVIEKRQGFKIACLEEIALNKNYINKTDLKKTLQRGVKNDYDRYLLKILENNNR